MSSASAKTDQRAPMRRLGEPSDAPLQALQAPANPLWDFYACGLVDEDESESEDTEDELETQDWIQFQRLRAQVRMANACQREPRAAQATKNC